VLLSRVAANLYWAARYLERAEDTARIVREHTNLLVDLPTSVPLTWEPLLAVTGDTDLPDDRRPSESTVVTRLLADRSSPSSIAQSVALAREDMRTTREVIPREVWVAANDLHLYVSSHADGAVARRSRARFLERVIAESQKIRGIVLGTMRHDEAFAMMRIGYLLERADMTTRVLDVRAAALLDLAANDPERPLFEDVQWTSVLRSLSALQMYHRTLRRPVDGQHTVRFLLEDRLFPRSIRYCLAEATEQVVVLPRHDAIADALDAALAPVDAAREVAVDAQIVRELCDRLQMGIARVHQTIEATWFRAGDGSAAQPPATAAPPPAPADA
jgi:uncharacterized alpha-E superfamily protein